MSNFKKLKLLMWKNWILQKRHKWQTVFEIMSPVVFSLILILLRCIVTPNSKPETLYQPFSPTYINMTRDIGNVTMKREVTLAFSPESLLTRSIVQGAMTSIAVEYLGMLAMFFTPEVDGHKDAAEMHIALTQPNAMQRILVGIEFPDEMANASTWPENIVVKLRFPAVMRTPLLEHPIKASWRTNLLYPLIPKPGPRYPEDNYGGKMPGYSQELFLAVQHAISREIIKKISGKPFNTNVMMQRMPHQPYIDDPLLLALEKFISTVIILCYTYTFVNTVRMVTSEKELQLRETMTIMGLSSWLHWLAWFLKQLAFLTLSVIIMMTLFKIPISSSEGQRFAVLTYTPWSVLFFFMMLFMMASLAFSFMVSVFFNRANTAASFMGLAWMTTYSFYMLTQVLYEDISLTTKVVLSLISNTALGYIFQMIVIYEGSGNGLQWADLFKPVSFHEEFMPGHLIFLFIFDTILYMAVAMYVEKIRPGNYGVPLPWYFPFTKTFWMSNRAKVAEMTQKDGVDSEYNDALLKVVHDEEPKGVPIGVNIKNLTKIYPGKRKAVDSLNLRMYENEITVLLGHNGAGKTTTLSMMTGLIEPTSGSALINGYDIVTETSRARDSIGICPQHNVLFPDLTVEEHLIFYLVLKGVPESKIKAEVEHFVQLLDLTEKRKTWARHLSGGQKRRLSVGAAMCGNSRVVLLDEPTSGLDPAARRSLWNLLLKEKKGRTIVLTTHFMDEADVLGDRIAIMSGGRLRCFGTPFFLKKHYGIGYKLTIVKGDQCHVDDITEFFKKYIPDIDRNSNIGSELTYIIPSDYVSKFPEMLKDFEENKTLLHAPSYGLSITSLEEVFMKVGAEDNVVVSSASSKRGSTASNNSKRESTVVPADMPNGNILGLEPIEKVRGFRLLRNQIKAMFLKHWYDTSRNKFLAGLQCALPIINITISVIMSRSWKFLSSLPALELSLESGFESTETLVSEKNLTDGSYETGAYLAYKDYFKPAPKPTMGLTDLGTMDFARFYLKLCKEDLSRVRYEVLVGATFAPKNITAWFSNFGYHDPAISLALVNNAILRSFSPNSSLTFVNKPLPYSIEHLVRVMASASSMGFMFAFNIGFCMAVVSAFIVIFAVKERVSGATLLQRVSGVRPAVMWGCAFVFDWLKLMAVCVCVVVTLACYQESTLSTFPELGRILLVLMVFSYAMIPLHYLSSLYFDVAAAGFSKMCYVNIFIGCMPFLILEVLRLPGLGSPYYAKIFDWVFAPLPLYCLSRSFRDMSVLSLRIITCDSLCGQMGNRENCTRATLCEQLPVDVCCVDDTYLAWSEPGIGRYLVIMLFVGTALFVLLLLKEYGILKKILPRKSKSHLLPPLMEHEDSDVAEERRLVKAFGHNELTRQSLVSRDLTKYYRKFLAVNRLSFCIQPGECFGLLGINGAGKTSTFRMLTGDTHASAGDAYVQGYSVSERIRDVYTRVSYCPQFDALFDNMTASETLKIFCLLRGIPVEVGSERGIALAKMLGFYRHYNKRVHQCSGGTKRKISTAVALLGDSPLVFLDEPTTGMDPASKRLVWSLISEAVAAGRSVVLTSHSMEECEALCSRLTIMVGGRLFCLGPLQHLKSKFSQGYTIIAKTKVGPNVDSDTESMNQYISENLAYAQLIESYLGMTTYYVKDINLQWWKIFDFMENVRQNFPLEDYSVAQTSLEQVFLQLTIQHHIESPEILE